MAKGDHIYVEGLMYDHHGIDCGDGMVIHYSGKTGRAKITKVSKEQFANGKQIKIKSYQKKYCSDGIVKRAYYRLSRSHEENYNVVFNNCEHFCFDCTTGEPDSSQVFNAGAGALGVVGTGVLMGTATTQVAAGGILGLLGVTTTVAAFPVAITLGGAIIAGAGVYKGLKWLDNQD